jgi:hypothetical protein
MKPTATGNRKTSGHLIAPVLLLAALIFPLVTSKAQSVKQKQQHATRQTEGAKVFKASDVTATTAQAENSQEGQTKVTVVRRVNQVRLTPTMARAIRSVPALRGVVIVRGRTVSSLKGSSIWLLSNGGYAIVETTTAPDEPNAMEVYRKNMGLCDAKGNCYWYFAACYCPQGDPNNDPCNFGGGHATRGNCRGGACCSFTDGLIDPNGVAQVF